MSGEWRQFGSTFIIRTPSNKIEIHPSAVNSEKWVMDCRTLGLWDLELESDRIEDAELEALDKVYDLLTQWIGEIERCTRPETPKTGSMPSSN